MAPLSIIWEDDALRLLEGRDRYTRNAIREEFRRNPHKDAVEIDDAQREFLTPVSENRFTVVWRLNEAAAQAVVRAVVPLTNISLDKAALEKPGMLDALKEYVGRVVEAEKNF